MTKIKKTGHKYVFDLDSNVVLPNRGKLGDDDMKTAKILFDEEDLKIHLITVLKECQHFVFPGFYALFRWLHDSGHEIHFFSSAVHERNMELVPILMQHAFGKSTASRRMKNIKIMSRQDLMETKRETYRLSENPEYAGWAYMDVRNIVDGPFHGEMKKRLRGVVCTAEELPNTLLLEDDRSYMAGGEEYNLVVASPESSCRIGEYFIDRNRACFYAGVIHRIESWCAAHQTTLVEGSKHVQFTSQGRVLDRDYFYNLNQQKEIYEEGFEILKTYDHKLRLHDGRPN